MMNVLRVRVLLLSGRVLKRLLQMDLLDVVQQGVILALDCAALIYQVMYAD